MAKPIRNTPILFGKDAELFRKEISQLPPSHERALERERIRKSIAQLQQMVDDLPE